MARRPPRTRRRLRGLAVALVVLALLVVAVGGVVAVLDNRHPAQPSAQVCFAGQGDDQYALAPAQANNAAMIAAVSVRRDLPARAATIAIATALQESRLINIDYGDRDSIGLFQQRPSQGWGTVEQIMDPIYATNAFYDVLIKVDGYQDLPVTEAAQAVQRSAFPEAYAQHEPRARAWASALTGYSTADLRCDLHEAEPGSGSAKAIQARLRRDYGKLPTKVTTPADAKTGATITVDARSLGDDVRSSWSVAQWAVATAADLGTVAVEVADQRWDRGADGWETSTTSVPSRYVRITLVPDED